MVAVPLEERGVEETLDALERLHRTRVIAEAGMFELAAHVADLHNGDTLAGVLSGGRVPGAERPVRLGGVGTPRVAEFASAELGARGSSSARSRRSTIWPTRWMCGIGCR